MNTTQQELIAALARRLAGQRMPAAHPRSSSEEPPLEIVIDLDGSADELIDLADA